jgi:hypothetical protein
MRFAALTFITLFASVAMTLAAPAPLPKPDRQRDQPVFNRVVEDLLRVGVVVREVTRKGHGRWVVTFVSFRGACTSAHLKPQSRHIDAKDRVEAVNVILFGIRQEDDRMLLMLRERGLIP